MISSKQSQLSKVEAKTTGQIPGIIAKYLKPNIYGFTVHSFRRTSASILADSVVDRRILKRHMDWKINAVAEGYVADSRSIQNKVAKTLGSIMNRINTMINENISVSTSESFSS